MLYIIQNDPNVPAGIYGRYLEKKQLPFQIVRPFFNEPLPCESTISGVIVLGGFMSVHDVIRYPFLVDVKGFVEKIVSSGKPFLGICLGGQLLAEVLGGRVHRNTCSEYGCHFVHLTSQGQMDPLFQGVDAQFIALQWHSDSFELPGETLSLAFSEACPNQAFRFGNAAYGLQFHPEVDEQIVAEWTRLTGSDNEALEGFRVHAPRFQPTWERMLENFLRII